MAKRPSNYDNNRKDREEQKDNKEQKNKRTTKLDLAKSENENKKVEDTSTVGKMSDFSLEFPQDVSAYSEKERRNAILGGRDPYAEYRNVSRRSGKLPIMAMEMTAPFTTGAGKGISYLGKNIASLGTSQKTGAIRNLSLLQRQQRAADFAASLSKQSEYKETFAQPVRYAVGDKLSGLGGGMSALGETMQGTMGGVFQNALGSTSTVRGIERARMLNRERNLGVSGNIYRGTNFLRTVNKLGYSANMLAALAGVSSGRMGSLTGMLGGGMMGLGGLKLLSGAAGFMTMRKIAIRRKSYTKEQRKHSIAPMIEQQLQMLISTEQLKPAEQMMIQLLTRIESNSVFSALMWEMMDLEKQKKEKQKENYDINYGEKTLGKHFQRNPVVKAFENLNADMNKLIIKFDPVTQLTNFLLTGKTPKKTLEQLEEIRGDTRKSKEALRKEQIIKGIRADQIRLMKLDAMTLTSTSSSTEERKMALMMGQYDLTRLIAQETLTMRKGMGIDKNVFFGGVNYEKGIFGKLVSGIVGGITAVPGINALSNIFKTVIKLPQSIAGAYKGAIRGGKNLLFGRKFTDLQDPKELDKQLGLYKPMERKADEFIAKGLPTELKSQTLALYEQLTVQKNIYEVANLMYKVQTKGLGEHRFDDDMYSKQRQRTFWDATEGRYLDKEAIEVLEETREDKRTFALESAFRKGLISKLTMDIPGLTKKENIRSDEERMKEYTGKYRKYLDRIGDVDDPFANEDLRAGYKSKRKLEMMPTTGIEDELFSIEKERYLRNMEENWGNKWGISGGKVGRNTRSAGWGLASLLGTVGAGALTAGTGGMAALLPLMFGGVIAGNAARPFTTSRKGWSDEAIKRAQEQFKGDKRISGDDIAGKEIIWGRSVESLDELITQYQEKEKTYGEGYEDTLEILSQLTEREQDDAQESLLDIIYHLQEQRKEIGSYFERNQEVLNQIRLNYNALTNKTNFLLENIAGILELNIADTLLDHGSKIDKLIELNKPRDINDQQPSPKPPSNIRDLISGRRMADDYDQLKAASKGGKGFKKALVGENITQSGTIKGYPEIVVGNFDVLGQKETKRYLNNLGIKTLADGDIEIAERTSRRRAATGSNWLRDIIETSGSGKDIERSISNLIHEIRVNVFGRTIGTIRRLVGENLNPEEVENEIADDKTVGSMFKGKKWAKLGWDLGEDFGIVGRLTGAIIGGSIGGITDWLGSEKLQKVKEKATSIGSKVIEKTASVFKTDPSMQTPPIMAFQKGGFGKGLGLVGERILPTGAITGSPQLVDGEYSVIGQDKTRDILDSLDFETLKGGTTRLGESSSIKEILLGSYLTLKEIEDGISELQNDQPSHPGRTPIRTIDPIDPERRSQTPSNRRTILQELEEVQRKKKEKEAQEYRAKMLQLLYNIEVNTEEDDDKIIKEEERDKKKTGALGMLAGLAPKLGGFIMKMGPALTAFAGIYSILKLRKDWKEGELSEGGAKTLTRVPALIRDVAKNTPEIAKKPFRVVGRAAKSIGSLAGRVGGWGFEKFAATDAGFDIVSRARGLKNRVLGKSSTLGKAGEIAKIGREGIENVSGRMLGTTIGKQIAQATRRVGESISTKAANAVFDAQFAARAAKKRLTRNIPSAVKTVGKTATSIASGAKDLATRAFSGTKTAGSTIKSAAESSPVLKSLGSIATRVGARLGIKAGAKAGSKAIPLLGFAASFGFGAKRLEEGDYVGAARELASGAVSLIPFVGAGASIGMDIMNAARVEKRKKQGLNKSGRLGAWLFDKFHKSDEERKEETRKDILDMWKKKMSSSAFKLLNGDHTRVHELRELGLIMKDKDNIYRTAKEMGITPEEFEKKKAGYEMKKLAEEKEKAEKKKIEAEKEEVRKIVAEKADSKEDLQSQMLRIWKRKMSPKAFEMLDGDYQKVKDLRAKGLIVRDYDGILKTIEEIEGKGANVSQRVEDAKKLQDRQKEKDEISQLINDKTSDPEKLERQILEIWRRNMSRGAFKLLDGDHKKVAELRAKGLIVRHNGKWKLISEISDDHDLTEIEKQEKKIKLDELRSKMSDDSFKLLNNEPRNFTNLLKEGKIKRTWFGLGPYDLTDKGRQALQKQQEALRTIQSEIGKEKEERKTSGSPYGVSKHSRVSEISQKREGGEPAPKVKMPYAPSPMSTVSGKTETMSGSSMDQALQTIIKQEGRYGSVNKDDAGKGVSLGKLQWHGDRARDLLRKLNETDPEKFREIMGQDMVDLISSDDVSWHGRKDKVTFNRKQSENFGTLMKDSQMQQAMDSLAVKDFEGYVNKGKSLGIEDPRALAYFADVANQYGLGGASKRFRDVKDKTLEGLHSVMKDTQYGERRRKVFNAVKNLPTNAIEAVQKTRDKMQEMAELQKKKSEPGKLERGKTSGKFTWPSKHNIITSPFGPRKVKGGSSNHKGMDIRAREGDPIFSVLPGIVLNSGNMVDRWGEVKIDHGGFSTRYLHNSEVLVEAGQEVEQGQQIAKGGGKGKGNPRKYTPHLHFEVQQGGRAIDPEVFLHNYDSSWTPSYTADIDKSRQLYARLKGTKPDISKEDSKESGEYGLSQTEWLTEARRRFSSTQNAINETQTTPTVGNETTGQPITVNKNSPIIVNPDVGNNKGDASQLKEDENFSRVDRKLDELVHTLFNNVCSSFDNIVGNYAFGSSTKQQFF